ncbi:MAG TPA: choice-of-anchor L domain-containing protein [Chitinophagaceae bacterium]|nr:choice-of-anchor L domain-containing protein [Chitinophagaceae bacterium]
MKRTLLLIVFSIITFTGFAQLTISPNQTATYLANKLVATSGTLGVTVTNAVLTCDTLANGEFNGVSNLGIADGIVLGTGAVATNSAFSQTGIDGLPMDMASTMLGTAGDAQITTLSGSSSYDACALEFDLQPVGNFVEFEYVFGSEEYPEYNCSAFNDMFGFFISGPGFSTPTNIALIPGTSTPVSINSINDGSVSTCTANTLLYVNNTGTTCTMDGFTTPLLATAPVTPSSTYHLKMVIADVTDGILNSYVVLKANSLKSGSTTPSGLSQTLEKAGPLELFPLPAENQITIRNTSASAYQLQLCDLSGRILHEYALSGFGQQVIDIHSLPDGYYSIKATNHANASVRHYSFTK